MYQYKDHLGNVRVSYKENTSRVEDDFSTSTDGWGGTYGGSYINNNNQKLNIVLLNKSHKTDKYLTIEPNTPLHIEFDYEKGNMEKSHFIIIERKDGIWQSATRKVINLTTNKHYKLDFTFTGDYIRVIFEKGDASDKGTFTTSYVDNFKLRQNGLEILEENNFYPFGLKHKGYNNVVNSSNSALK